MVCEEMKIGIVRTPTPRFVHDSGGRWAAAGTSGGGSGNPAMTLTYNCNGTGTRKTLVDTFSTVGPTTYSDDG